MTEENNCILPLPTLVFKLRGLFPPYHLNENFVSPITLTPVADNKRTTITFRQKKNIMSVLKLPSPRFSRMKLFPTPGMPRSQKPDAEEDAGGFFPIS